MTKSIVAIFLSILSLNALADFDETLIQTPIKESNEVSLYGSACRTREHGRWDICFSVDEKENRTMRSFKFTNYGENKIVPMSGFGIGREYEFNFEDLARSDMGLLIWDAPDEAESHAHLKMLFFFPREIMPAIRYESDSEKDILIVTLPTREEVIFNGKTREVISGVLAEGPIKVNKKGEAQAPDVTYQGSGVVIEASALADWPVGASALDAAKNVSIKKKGYKTCLVPGKDLWYTDSSKGGNVMFNKSLISDAAFDSFVVKRCGFSIY